MCDSEWGQLNGQYVVVVRNQQHIETLMQSESKLLTSLIKNHISVVFKEDVHMIQQPIEIILDYFNQPVDIIETNILSFQTLFQKSYSQRPIPKLRELKKIRQTRSFEIYKKPLVNERLYSILNIERKQEQLTKDETYIFRDLSKAVDPMIIKGFNDDYQFGILIVTYEKLGLSHIDLLNEVIKLYVQQKNQKTLIYLNQWLDYRQVDLINDNSVFCTIFMQFLNLVELINCKQENELQLKIKNILNGKKNIFTTTLNSPSPTSLQRKQSFHHPQKNKRFRNLSMQISNQSIHDNLLSQFDGNQFYLNCKVETLQKQFWIIDVEQFSKISITAMLNSNHLIKNDEISDYFDYLLFHMVFSTIISTKEEQFQIIKKFIQLYQLSKDAKHFQMLHILYTYFNHYIIQSILKSIYALNPLQKTILQEIIEKEHYRTLIPIDINDRQGIIPCFSLIQLYVYKFQDIKDKQTQKLELLAQQLFQIAHLQVLINKLNGLQTNYKDEYIYKYLKKGLKYELLGYFGCTKQNIEIQILKFYNNKI